MADVQAIQNAGIVIAGAGLEVPRMAKPSAYGTAEAKCRTALCRNQGTWCSS